MRFESCFAPWLALLAYPKQTVSSLQPETHEEGIMKTELHHYVGRAVRLNKLVYQEIKNRALRKGHALENCFLVTGISRGVHKLICYGANFRIVVDVADVVLI